MVFGAVSKEKPMISRTHLVLSAAVILALVGCASVAAKPSNLAVAAVPMDHYSGTWLEIARRPMMLTNGCVAGFTTYRPGDASGVILVEDGCHKQTPNGQTKTIRGKAEILDAGATNAKLRVHYPFFITWEYWVLYEAPDHSWFISADPTMKNLWIYARKVPTQDERAAMVAKAQALGYDTGKLEFPAF